MVRDHDDDDLGSKGHFERGDIGSKEAIQDDGKSEGLEP
jgi:hypothetical protein